MEGWSEKQVWALSLGLRLTSACLVRTWFVPDETWQSLEPAHRLVFGRGALSWEWEAGLRSYLLPLFFAAPWAVLKALHLDFRAAVVATPALQMALLASLADVSLFKLAKRFHGPRVAFWSLVSYASMWFGLYCAPRTLGNSVETALLLIGLDHYPWPEGQLAEAPGRRGAKRAARSAGRQWLYLASACLATLVRPTAALLWAPLCLWHLARCPLKLRFLVRECLPIGLPLLLLNLVVDRVGYGRWLCSPWNFLRFNVLEGGSAHFGVHPWHWYLWAGLPTVLTLHLVPIGLGLVASKRRVFACLCGLYLLVHSALAHKEQRFLLPLLPLLSIYSGEWLERESRRPLSPSRDQAKELHRRQEAAALDSVFATASLRARAMVVALALVNTAVFLYTGLVHQAGPMAVTKALHSEAVERGGRLWAEFLLPCHSTPLHSHVHAAATLRFLRCEPDWDGRGGREDEADAFHRDPHAWLANRLPRTTTHVVLYDAMAQRLASQLDALGFRLKRRLFHSHFPQGDRQGHYLHLLSRPTPA